MENGWPDASRPAGRFPYGGSGGLRPPAAGGIFLFVFP